MSDIKWGDIITYESDDVKYIILFRDWYKPYYGHINYFALYDGKDIYYKGTCFVMDVDLLRPATQEEKDLILKLAADEGYTWNDDTKRLIGLYNKSEKI